jgi:hypothetical protein
MPLVPPAVNGTQIAFLVQAHTDGAEPVLSQHGGQLPSLVTAYFQQK